MTANDTLNSKEALQEEKQTIETQLARLTSNGKTNFADMGTDEDDNAHEVAQFEIDTSVVATLQKRLEEINTLLAG